MINIWWNIFKLKEFETENAKARQGTSNDLVSEDSNISSPVNTSDDSTKDRALEVIAKIAGVGHVTAFQYDKIQTKGTEWANSRSCSVDILIFFL